MNEKVSVEKLIERFREMANRGSLLLCNNATQEDLLSQIIGTIVTVAIDEPGEITLMNFDCVKEK